MKTGRGQKHPSKAKKVWRSCLIKVLRRSNGPIRYELRPQIRGKCTSDLRYCIAAYIRTTLHCTAGTAANNWNSKNYVITHTITNRKKNYNQISEKRSAVVKLWIAPRFVSVTISTVMRVNYYRTRQVKQNKKGHSIIKFFSNTHNPDQLNRFEWKLDSCCK